MYYMVTSHIFRKSYRKYMKDEEKKVSLNWKSNNYQFPFHTNTFWCEPSE